MSLTPTPNRSCKLSTVELCACDVSRLFTENVLLLNPAKTEPVFFGTRQRLSQLDGSQGIDAAATHTVTQFKDAVKLLGVTLDSTFCFTAAEIYIGCPCHLELLLSWKNSEESDSLVAINGKPFHLSEN